MCVSMHACMHVCDLLVSYSDPEQGEAYYITQSRSSTLALELKYLLIPMNP